MESSRGRKRNGTCCMCGNVRSNIGLWEGKVDVTEQSIVKDARKLSILIPRTELIEDIICRGFFLGKSTKMSNQSRTILVRIIKFACKRLYGPTVIIACNIHDRHHGLQFSRRVLVAIRSKLVEGLVHVITHVLVSEFHILFEMSPQFDGIHDRKTSPILHLRGY